MNGYQIMDEKSGNTYGVVYTDSVEDALNQWAKKFNWKSYASFCKKLGRDPKAYQVDDFRIYI